MPKLQVTMFMNMSVNGMIADVNDQVSWSKSGWEEYFNFVHSSGALIVGRRSYDLMMSENEVTKLGDIHIAVLSKTPRKARNKIAFFSDPGKAIEHLTHQSSVKRIVLGGGTTINTLFLEMNLIDDAVLAVDSVFMPHGKPLFNNLTHAHQVEPAEAPGPLGNGCICLHYRFKRAQP
jgi:dihydrofolate reductase